MNKTKLLLLALLALTLTGCEDNRQDSTESVVSRELVSEKITRDGHSYIYFYVTYGTYRPINIIHDPDCPCREKGDKTSE